MTSDALTAFFSSFKDNTTALKVLNLEECREMPAEALKIFAVKFPMLEKLNLQWCSAKVHDEGVQHLFVGCTRLKKLKLTGCKQISDKCILDTLKLIDRYDIENEDLTKLHA